MRTKHSLLLTLGAVAIAVATLLLSGCASVHRYHGTSFNGSVVAIDLHSQNLTLGPLSSAAPITFNWNASSKFWANGVRIEPRQLHTGDVLRVHFIPNSEPKIIQHLYLQTNRTVE